MPGWDDFIRKNQYDLSTVRIQFVGFFLIILPPDVHLACAAVNKRGKAAFWDNFRRFRLNFGAFLLQLGCGGGATTFSIVFAAAAVASTTFFTQRNIASEAHASNSLICQPMRRLPIQSVNYGAINYCLQNINETCSLCAKTSRPRRDCACVCVF